MFAGVCRAWRYRAWYSTRILNLAHSYVYGVRLSTAASRMHTIGGLGDVGHSPRIVLLLLPVAVLVFVPLEDARWVPPPSSSGPHNSLALSLPSGTALFGVPCDVAAAATAAATPPASPARPQAWFYAHLYCPRQHCPEKTQLSWSLSWEHHALGHYSYLLWQLLALAATGIRDVVALDSSRAFASTPCRSKF